MYFRLSLDRRNLNKLKKKYIYFEVTLVGVGVVALCVGPNTISISRIYNMHSTYFTRSTVVFSIVYKFLNSREYIRFWSGLLAHTMFEVRVSSHYPWPQSSHHPSHLHRSNKSRNFVPFLLLFPFFPPRNCGATQSCNHNPPYRASINCKGAWVASLCSIRTPH